jgi:hypothetical protein
MGEVLEDHGLADAVRADEHGVVAAGEEAEAKRSSTASRSIFLGQDQSKSAMGLKPATREFRRRRSRLRL